MMAGRKLDAEIGRLYQLPLADFTAARNTMAKAGGAAVRSLEKPTVAAWAVNQLYWRERRTYDALIAAAGEQRRVHKTVLAGRAGDLRESGKSHDQAVEQALKATLALLAREGHPVTEATRQAILATLRALPAEEAPGRLTRTLQPGGFEMLAGLTSAGREAKPASSASGKPATRPASTPASKTEDAGDTAGRAKARASAKAQVEEATRKLKQAEQAARREEFESARAAREAEKAGRRAAEAREAFEAAREALEEAEADIPAMGRARDASARRAQQAAAALDAARAALVSAQARLAKL